MSLPSPNNSAIPRVRLERSGIETSRLGFGTSRLHHVRSSVRQRLLHAAVDLGFTHIDTAPLYGDTLAEAAIGSALGSHRHQVVITTKYGLYPSSLGRLAPELGAFARLSQQGWRRLTRSVGNRTPMTSGGLRRSVKESLRRLRIDYLDILLLHEPTFDKVSDAEVLLYELERLQTLGIIRAFGVAGSGGSITKLEDLGLRIGQVVQTHERDWSTHNPPEITYGAISRGPQFWGQRALDSRIACKRLRAALSRRPNGVVLVSTTDPQHLSSLAEAF